MTLPSPDSDEFNAIPLARSSRAIYRLLYDSRGTPLTMLEIRDRLGSEVGPQEQLDRRRRELNPYVEIEKVGRGRDTAYRLVGRKVDVYAAIAGISERDRAIVLQHGRCAMCGRTPVEDGVRLQVDHKIPKEWGGTDDLENLQPLCEECNRGKKNHFSTYDVYADKIRHAITWEEPHRRIGELLKAFFPDEVRSDLVEIVAHSRQYQEDWQKRLRELRVLGWEIETRRRKEDGRVRVYYRLLRFEPWPRGAVRAEIRRRERARGYK